MLSLSGSGGVSGEAFYTPATRSMLTRPGVSPLYNPRLNADLLDLALHRVEAGVEPS